MFIGVNINYSRAKKFVHFTFPTTDLLVNSVTTSKHSEHEDYNRSARKLAMPSSFKYHN
jgi:hypothetical protein